MNFPNLKILSRKNLYLNQVSDSISINRMTLGPKSKQLELEIKKLLNAKHIILTTSGTSALMMATLALNFKKNQTAICSNLAWVAATNPILICGGNIKVVDTLKGSEIVDYNELNSAIKRFRPNIVILIHLNGQRIYNKEFNILKKKYKFKVIEDCAQSLLTADTKGLRGSVYDIGCFSLSIAKPIHMVYGGFCATNNDKIAQKLIAIRDNGVFPKNLSKALATSVGLNFKPSDLHSSIGLENIKYSENISNKLKNLYRVYVNNLKNPKIKMIRLINNDSVPNFATAIIKDKYNFRNFCLKNKIQVSNGCTTLTATKLIKGNSRQLKNSIETSKYLFRLPFGTGYSEKEIKKICNLLNKF